MVKAHFRVTLLLPVARRRPLAFALATALTANTQVQAQSIDYGALEDLFGEAVTTSVTGSPQRASAVPATVEILTAEDIRRSGATTIPGILRQVSGMDVLQWTASHSDVAVRGYNKAFSSRLLVLVNGRQIYADHYGYVPWSALPVELGEIRQIEVVKGPNSALFGFNATGGVINIITFSPAHDDVSFVTVRAGSQDHVEISAASTLQAGDDLFLRLSAGLRKSDDFDTPLSPLNTGVRQGDERQSLRLDLHYQAADSVELELEATHTRLRQTAMSPSYSMGYEDKLIRSLKGSLHADTRYGLSQVQLYRNWIDNDVYANSFDFANNSFVFNPTPIVVFDNDLTVASLQHIFKAGPAHTLRVGGEYREGRLPTVPLNIAVVSYDVGALSGMWEWQLAPEVTFTLAMRRDELSLKRSGPIPPALGLRNADWDVDLQAESYNAALLWQLDARNVLRLNAGRGVQLPSLFNFGGSLVEFPVPPEFQPPEAFYTTGLPGIQPTTVDSVELSWDHEFALAPLSLRMSAFYGESSEIIADSGFSDFLAAIFSAPANIGDSRTNGVEIALDARSATGAGWTLGYLYQDIDDNFGELYPDWLTYANFADTTPRHLLNAGLHWTQGAWEADAYLYYKSEFSGLRVDESYVFDPTDPTSVPDVRIALDDYVSMDLHLGYRVNEQLRFDIQARNLLDSPQVQTSGPQVERRILGSLTWSF